MKARAVGLVAVPIVGLLILLSFNLWRQGTSDDAGGGNAHTAETPEGAAIHQDGSDPGAGSADVRQSDPTGQDDLSYLLEEHVDPHPGQPPPRPPLTEADRAYDVALLQKKAAKHGLPPEVATDGSTAVSILLDGNLDAMTLAQLDWIMAYALDSFGEAYLKKDDILRMIAAYPSLSRARQSDVESLLAKVGGADVEQLLMMYAVGGGSRNQQVDALGALSRMKELSSGALDRLWELYMDPRSQATGRAFDRDVERPTAALLVRFTPREILLGKLGATESSAKTVILTAMALDPTRPDDLGRLHQLAGHDDLEIRLLALRRLHDIRPDSPTWAVVQSSARSAEPEDRLAAIDVMESWGIDFHPAIDDSDVAKTAHDMLQQMVTDPDEEVARRARSALDAIR